MNYVATNSLLYNEISNGLFHFSLCVYSKALKTENCLSPNQEQTKKRKEEKIKKERKKPKRVFSV